jgi:3-deoxy-D-manno-octulosonic-acid transferase
MYDLILARGDEDARRLRAIGVDMKKVLVNGDVKVDAITEQRAACSKMLPGIASRVSLGGGPMFVAGSTHEGEDEALIRAFLGIKSSGVRGAMLAIAPRHPGRSRAVLEMAGRGGRAALFSELSGGESPPPEIVIIDTIGPLYGFYGIAACAFIGGSLVPKGGQNILEPASWGVPVLHGPFMEDFAAPTAELDALGASYRVNGHEDIEALWRKAMLGELPDPSVHCAEYFSRKSGAAARAWAHLERYL